MSQGAITINEGTQTKIATDIVGGTEYGVVKIDLSPLGSSGVIWNGFSEPYITNIDYNSGVNPVYIGKATPNSSGTVSVWLIKKITYDANNNPTAILYAGGSATYTNIWNNRASLSYS